jgi:uncharacterized protein
MLGGAYLCFEGAEKVLHVVLPHAATRWKWRMTRRTPRIWSEEKVAGAIKTDFILSAEIMTIALSTLPEGACLANRRRRWRWWGW